MVTLYEVIIKKKNGWLYYFIPVTDVGHEYDATAHNNLEDFNNYRENAILVG